MHFGRFPCPATGNPSVAGDAGRGLEGHSRLWRDPYPYRDRRAHRARRALGLPQRGAALHDELSHALPGISRCARARPGEVELRGPATVPQCRLRHAREHAFARTRPEGPRLSPPSAMDPRRGHGAVPAPARRRSDAAAADLPVRRSRGRREEPAGLPRPRSARHQSGGRRRTGAIGA
jgi:hypothetical protein